MTTTNDRVALTAAVERIAADLRRAQRDVALLQRLKDAEATTKRLTAELQEAQDALTAANVAELQAQRAAAYSRFIDITVSKAVIEGPMGGVLHTPYLITVTAKTFNGYESVPEVLTFNGFKGLPSDAFGYLIEVHPEEVPAAIRELAPDDLYEAFGRYFAALRRGYMSIPAAA
jgi:hypothetical protein